MKLRELFEEVEDWFWKLEYNPERNSYELYLGIPNDWVYSKSGNGIIIEPIHQLEENSIIKITTDNENLSVDDIIQTAKNLILKNKELEKKKEEHRLEMEKLKEMLIEKEKNFLKFIDQVKDETIAKKEMTIENQEPNENRTNGDTVIIEDKMVFESSEMKDQFIDDIEKLKLS